MQQKLKKQLTFFSLFSLATGTMISSGFFLLPGIAAAMAGPAVVLAFFLAGLLAVPAMLSQAELATAMPRAGGTYYFLDRSMGPLAGTIGGLGVWLSLMLKAGFGLVGFGAYSVALLHDLNIDLPLDMKSIMLGLALVLTLLNLFGARVTGRFQTILVLAVLTLLGVFIYDGIQSFQHHKFQPFLPHGLGALWSTTGMVFISYMGLTKIASLAEETRDPDRNLPLSMSVSLVVVMVLYTLGVSVIISALEPASLYRSLTPVSDAARVVMGEVGHYLTIAAALFAFISCANAGLLSASRYPYAMARDGLMPPGLQRLGYTHTPYPAILLTAVLTILFVFTLDVKEIAKLASAFQLLIFAFVNLAVIVMRESRVPGYDPGYHSPLYPWMQIFGILAPLFIIVELGLVEILFSLGVIAIGALWYYLYGTHHADRRGAWTWWWGRAAGREIKPLELTRELRVILKERGLRAGDPFPELVLRAPVLDLPDHADFVAFFTRVGRILAEHLDLDANAMRDAFLLRNKIGETPVEHGIAIPHIQLEGLDGFFMILARSRKGLQMPESPEPVHALFVLIGPRDQAALHLRILAALAARADQEGFIREWLDIEDNERLKAVLLGIPPEEMERIRLLD